MTPRSTALLEGEEGFPYRKGLTARYAEGTHTSIIYPGLYIGATLDCGYSLTITPVDVSHTRVEIAVMFEREITERDDFEEVSKRYQKTFIAISEEDNAINELQYAGLNSPLAQPGPFSWREEGVHWICRWVAGRIVGEPAPTRGAAE
jgi:phenylpropionate dioxygenase-like ring-hydroxylating dioxygenase large terminal subunit